MRRLDAYATILEDCACPLWSVVLTNGQLASIYGSGRIFGRFQSLFALASLKSIQDATGLQEVSELIYFGFVER